MKMTWKEIQRAEKIVDGIYFIDGATFGYNDIKGCIDDDEVFSLESRCVEGKMTRVYQTPSKNPDRVGLFDEIVFVE